MSGRTLRPVFKVWLDRDGRRSARDRSGFWRCGSHRFAASGGDGVEHVLQQGGGYSGRLKTSWGLRSWNARRAAGGGGSQLTEGAGT